ncbi:NAD(P)/FAD-dependent oxidoreductase [Acidianus sp. HS-5]|uniref:phytoene desaturase family protein n=1 Tax=Acidianus sp. HS-5 TaxID=2886040 RepID=UPI001F3AF9E3|nr:NAD(P)/FAD-dependent oxidoreductase [Acidianus sp. HS-5]BDC17974.1 FAD-dependent oxidoreductase [Acidianus sp. HS-5]
MRAIVIGAGHNGLIASYYLRKTGFDVIIFDNRLGGMTDTTVIKGVKISRASYVLGLMPRKFVEEFEIPVIQQDPVQTIWLEDRVIPFWRDREKRIKELVNAGEDKFPEFEEKITKFKELLERKFTFVTTPPSEKEVREEAKKIGVEDVMRPSKEFLSKYLSEDLHYSFIYPGMENSPGYLVSYFYNDWSFVKGGMGTVAENIYEKAKKIGVDLINEKIDKILVENDKAVGVKVKDKVYKADVILSTASPAETMRLAEYDHKFFLHKPGWVKYNVILREIPKVCERIKGFLNSIIDFEGGEVVIPSVLDDNRGGVVMEFMGNYDEVMERFKGEILHVDKLNAKNAEEIYNLPAGDLNHLPMREPYLFDGRPEKGWGYKTPINNLYLGGAGTYPGGQVSGIPGYNSARLIILDKLGRDLIT